MARWIRKYNETNTVCTIVPEKLPEGLQVACTAKPNEILVNGQSMSLEAVRLLREALSLAIIVSEGMVRK